jgi:hypothetical protein
MLIFALSTTPKGLEDLKTESLADERFFNKRNSSIMQNKRNELQRSSENYKQKVRNALALNSTAKNKRDFGSKQSVGRRNLD